MKVWSTLVLFISFISIFSSCNSSSNSSSTPASSSAQGNFRLLATDDPFPYSSVSSVVVNISSINAHTAQDTLVTVSSQPIQLELTRLRNGVTSVLSDIDIPPGTYDQVRLIVDSAVITTSDGTVWTIKVPSGSESGLKLNIAPPLNVSTDVSTDLVLDFDLSRSIVSQGNPKTPAGIKGFIFKPVIRMTNLTTAGTLSGTVHSDANTPAILQDDTYLASAFVQVVGLDDVVIGTAVTDVTGHYQIIGIPAGSYTVKISAEGFSEFSVSEITIPAGNVVTQDATLALGGN